VTVQKSAGVTVSSMFRLTSLENSEIRARSPLGVVGKTGSRILGSSLALTVENGSSFSSQENRARLISIIAGRAYNSLFITNNFSVLLIHIPPHRFVPAVFCCQSHSA